MGLKTGRGQYVVVSQIMGHGIRLRWEELGGMDKLSTFTNIGQGFNHLASVPFLYTLYFLKIYRF